MNTSPASKAGVSDSAVSTVFNSPKVVVRVEQWNTKNYFYWSPFTACNNDTGAGAEMMIV